MGSGSRADLANLKESKHLPGPGNYHTLNEASVVKRSAPAYGFGSSKRDESLEKKHAALVGPGAYELKSIIGLEGRKNSISPKLEDRFRERESRNMPGPASYNSSAT